jgi:endonuclease III
MSLSLGYFDINKLYDTSLDKIYDVIEEGKLSSFPERHAKIIYNAVHKIAETPFMDGDASKIWSGRPKGSEVVLRFLDFDGCGFNSANSGPILLWRFFGVDFSDYSSIDLAPEAHDIRIFQRMGLIPHVRDKDAARIYVICKARELNPSFPGIIDAICRDVGNKYCKIKSPLCDKCPFCTFCENKPEINEWAAYGPESGSSHIG